jgi:hypothetical protein
MEFVEASMKRQPENPLSETVAGVILGAPGFVEWVKNNFVRKREKDRDLPSVNRMQVNPITIDAIRTRVKDEKVISEKMRAMIELYFRHKYTGVKLKELQEMYPRLTISGISQSCRRLEMRRNKDKVFNERIKMIEDDLVFIGSGKVYA